MCLIVQLVSTSPTSNLQTSWQFSIVWQTFLRLVSLSKSPGTIIRWIIIKNQNLEGEWCPTDLFQAVCHQQIVWSAPSRLCCSTLARAPAASAICLFSSFHPSGQLSYWLFLKSFQETSNIISLFLHILCPNSFIFSTLSCHTRQANFSCQHDHNSHYSICIAEQLLEINPEHCNLENLICPLSPVKSWSSLDLCKHRAILSQVKCWVSKPKHPSSEVFGHGKYNSTLWKIHMKHSLLSKANLVHSLM